MSNLVGYILSPLVRSYKRFKYGRLVTFTYFIPAPPQRKTGYREREFDGLIDKLTHMGFSLVSVNQQSQGNGINVIVTMRAYSQKAQNLAPNDFPLAQNDQADHLPTQTEDTIEGLYYID